MNYSEKLNNCREKYPFKYWLEDFYDGIGLYTPENLKMVSAIFDSLIYSLIALGENTNELKKLTLFEVAVKKLNLIRKETPNLIETMEREEFCELLDLIAKEAGVEFNGLEESIADKWREW